MKKIKTIVNRATVWFMLHFCNKVVSKIEFDAFKVVFRKYTMEIETKSGNMILKTRGMLYPNAFLYDALTKGDEKVVEWFCNQVYQFVSLITTDNGFIQDIHKAFMKYYKRIEKKAESIAKSISKDDDKINEEVVKANIETAKMNKEERKAHKENIREILTQNDDLNG